MSRLGNDGMWVEFGVVGWDVEDRQSWFLVVERLKGWHVGLGQAVER